MNVQSAQNVYYDIIQLIKNNAVPPFIAVQVRRPLSSSIDDRPNVYETICIIHYTKVDNQNQTYSIYGTTREKMDITIQIQPDKVSLVVYDIFAQPIKVSQFETPNNKIILTTHQDEAAALQGIQWAGRPEPIHLYDLFDTPPIIRDAEEFQIPTPRRGRFSRLVSPGMIVLTPSPPPFASPSPPPMLHIPQNIQPSAQMLQEHPEISRLSSPPTSPTTSEQRPFLFVPRPVKPTEKK